MSVFTRCSYIKCKSGLPGLVIPIGSFLPKSVDGKAVPGYMPRGHAIMSDLRLCESCALSANIHDIVNDTRWKDICHKIHAQGGTPPDRETLKLELGWPKDQPVPKWFKDALKLERHKNLLT